MTARKGNDRPLLRVKKFKGLMTADSAYEIGVDAQTIATNVDITRQNKIKRRNGFTQRIATAITAAWANDRSMLYQSGTTLTSVDSAYATTVVRTGLTASAQLHAYQIKDIIYYSNGYEVGCIENGVDRALGINSPARAVLTATTGGEMPPGIYQVAVSYVRNDGFESGVVLPATSVTLAGGNTAITVGSVAANGAMLVNYYVTQADGDVLYFAGQGPTGASTTLSANPSLLRRSMKARNTNPPLPFTQIEHYNGRILYAIGDTLYFSDPFAYEQIDYAKGFIPFQNKITMIAVMDDGFFIGTTEDTYFLSGDRVGELDLTSVADYGVVVDTRAYLDGAVVGTESATTKKTPAWISTKGMCIGFQDGSMQNVTESTVILPEGVTGASFFRQENGQNHFISVIRS
jgi:hypothetical protein